MVGSFFVYQTSAYAFSIKAESVCARYKIFCLVKAQCQVGAVAVPPTKRSLDRHRGHTPHNLSQRYSSSKHRQRARR